jgi:hypothetical protein
VPKIGPFKGLGFDNPTPQTEDLYIKSINVTVVHYRALLKDEGAGTLVLPNCDLDSGSKTEAAEYTLTDDTYASLLARLAAHKFDRTSPQLRDNILSFYSDLSTPIETKKHPSLWLAVLTNLRDLKAATPLPVPANPQAVPADQPSASN